ncbi:transferrin-like [Belonocnema kinseyi]|uniref:transferrin-like n=1 Tax=Belonocnema kinseyi TaxID=2817044 RepID=UPI00143D1CF2|nr:transferrin-like [Belonocnema kinseyi]
MWKFILLALFCGSFVSAKEYKICRSSSGNNDDECARIKKGDSSVSCVKVLDATDCALKLIKNEVDFGVFTPDELFLIYQVFPNRIKVSHELRHRERTEEIFEHQMVALVSLNETTGDLNSFKDGGLCHPGFVETQSFNDRILKEFERSATGSECNEELTYAENELLNLNKFFGKSCRPGRWVADQTLDATLKQKYPELCALCGNKTACSYTNSENHGHIGALECVKEKRGRVAYVALNYARDYVNNNYAKVPMFQMLCSNGTLKRLEFDNPCAWVQQRWSVIAAREDSADELAPKLTKWLVSSNSDDWTKALRDIVIRDDLTAKPLPKLIPHSVYLSENRTASSLDLPEYKKCGKGIHWCTINEAEKSKCQWVANAAAIFGITPKISCEKTSSYFECFRSISEGKTDIMTIDSHYGYVARKGFSLSTVIYADIDGEQSNVVLAVIKNSASSNFSSLQDLKGKRACFPEYGGISWMSFLNVVRKTNLTSHGTSCDFKQIASEIWSEACVPGIEDSNYKRLQISSSADGKSSLCSLCSEYNCQANDKNIYFRDDGALKCIENNVADIAFIKTKNLNDFTVIANQDQYRVLCKNGSLATNTGFNVDDNCTWAITIDSEVVSRNTNSEVDESNIVEVLLKLDKWFSYYRTPIHLYKQFNNTKDLLFKDSTVSLVSKTSDYKKIQAYKELMAETEKCSPSSATLSFLSASLLILSLIFNVVP